MKFLALLPVLAIILVSGCVGQLAPPPGAPPGAPPAEPPAAPPTGPGITEPAREPLPPPTSMGIGFVLVTPQPGQTIYDNKVSVVATPVNFTVVDPGTPVREKEGYFVFTLDSMPPVTIGANGPAYTHVFTDLEAGDHTLTAEVLTADGRSLTPPLVRTLIFTTA